MFHGKLPLTMLVFGYIFVILCPGIYYCNPCITSDQVIHYPKASSLDIRVIPDAATVIIAGQNFSVVCTSYISKEYENEREDGQPYEIKMFYNTKFVKICGSEDEKEDMKTCTWTITNASVGSSGNYSCMEQNVMMCTITTMLVSVEEPSPPNITIYPMDGQMVASGSNVNLSCEASGVPPPKILWFKDGNRIPNSSVKDGKGFSVMAFESVRPNDRGHYWCEANSTEGWVQSPAVVITVLWKPYFESHPGDMSVYEGETVTLFCSATGFPEPVIGWLKGNLTIRNFSSNGRNSSLVLYVVKKEAANGEYRCVARNSLGETFSLEGTVTVLTRQKTRENARGKATSFNPVWVGLGVVAVILLVSTTLVLVKKHWRARKNKTDGDAHESQREETVTGYARF